MSRPSVMANPAIPVGIIVMAGLDPAVHDVPHRTKLGASIRRHRVDGRVNPPQPFHVLRTRNLEPAPPGHDAVANRTPTHD